MGDTCSIVPRVLNKKNEKVDSTLFKNLVTFSENRNIAVELYQKIKSDVFIKKFQSKLLLDDNNEPLLSELIKKVGLDKYIKKETIKNRLGKILGSFKKNSYELNKIPNTKENFKELFGKMKAFNSNSEFKNDFIAVINTYPGTDLTSTIALELEYKTRESTKKADDIEYNTTLNEKLTDMLASYGVSVGALSELEIRRGIHGVTEFNKARDAAEGLIEIIRIAKGKEKDALPEEFSHFVLEAMKSNPLVERLINLVSSEKMIKHILKDEYNTYLELYKNDKLLLATEAAGKLLSRHILKQEEVPNKSYKSLLTRLKEAFKQLFGRISEVGIQNKIIEADKAYGAFTKSLMSGSFNKNIDIKNISSTNSFYKVERQVKKTHTLLTNMIATEIKRLNILQKRTKVQENIDKQKNLIHELQVRLSNNNELEGINHFLESSLNNMKFMDNKLLLLNTEASTDLKTNAALCRTIRNYIHSYRSMFNDAKDILAEEKFSGDHEIHATISKSLNEAILLLGELESDYNKVVSPLFANFLRPFFSDVFTTNFGTLSKTHNENLTLEALLKESPEDIGLVNRWLDSMAQCSDPILKLIDDIVKRRKDEARKKSIIIKNKIIAAQVKLEQAGIKDTRWMFEQKKDGTLEGDGIYVTEVSRIKYNRARKQEIKRLTEKYGEKGKRDKINYIGELQKWFSINGISKLDNTGEYKIMPNPAIYGKEYQAIMKNPAKAAYYNEIMAIKEELDSMLQDHSTSLNNAVKIRKDLIERLKSSNSLSEVGSELIKAVKDTVIRRSDDEEFGEAEVDDTNTEVKVKYRKSIKDFEGNMVQTLPILYTKLYNDEDVNDLSTDVSSTLITYSAMTTEYSEMSKVIDILEVGRDLLRHRKVVDTKNHIPLIEKLDIDKNTILGKLYKTQGTNVVNRLNDYFDMQIYGKMSEDSGTFGNTNIDVGKSANLLAGITVLGSYALNGIAALSNVSTGNAMMSVEAATGEFFNMIDLARADKIYGTELLSVLGELGKRAKTSKLNLWNELFNVEQDYENKFKEYNLDRKTWFSRLMSQSTLFFLSNSGEHWMKTRTSLALAEGYKMRSPGGNKCSLWDAMEVVYTDPNNKALGAMLKLKKGYTKEDGSEFTQADETAFSRRVSGINNDLHGIYNKIDRMAFKKKAIGRLLMIFRSWMMPSINRRYGKASANLDIGKQREGFHRTMTHFIWALIKDLKQNRLSIATTYDSLSREEQLNIRRSFSEISLVIALAAFKYIMYGLQGTGVDDDDEKKNRTYASYMFELQVRRLYTELGSLTPGAQMATEGMRLIKSPSAAINIVEGFSSLIGMFDPYNYTDASRLKSGRYKGETRASKILYESPLFPTNKTIYKFLHPENSILFYK